MPLCGAYLIFQFIPLFILVPFLFIVKKIKYLNEYYVTPCFIFKHLYLTLINTPDTSLTPSSAQIGCSTTDRPVSDLLNVCDNE